MRLTHLLLLALLSLAFLAGGCGSDDDDTPSGDETGDQNEPDPVDEDEQNDDEEETSALPELLLNPEVAGHPGPQPRVGFQDEDMDSRIEVSEDGMTTRYWTKKTHFEPSEPFNEDATNLLTNVNQDVLDSAGDPIPNTLPSTPENPYNLHPDPVIEEIDPRSPRWDLERIIRNLKVVVDPEYRRKVSQTVFRGGSGVPADPLRGRVERLENESPGQVEQPYTSEIDYEAVDFALAILEGEPIDRAYSGMALLNYTGPERVKAVDPETKTVTVNQAWMRSNIKSDTMFIDPTTIPPDETWTIRYHINVLHWGEADFAPMQMVFDDPLDVGRPNVPNVAYDASFFPMQAGKRYTFELAMPPHRYWNLNYNWSWRVHPPRIQAIEKAVKAPMGKNIVQWESDVFGETPRADEESKLAAINMIGDLAPAKRMWKALRALKELRDDGTNAVGGQTELDLVRELEAAFDDWKDRSRLPRGVKQAEGYDQTLVYLNNTIYGGMNAVGDKYGEAQETWDGWQTRGATLKTKLYNGDYFPHAYMNVDFGGRRGWENQFHSSVAVGGQGPWFTFGRFHWDRNLSQGVSSDNPGPRPVLVPAAQRPEELMDDTGDSEVQASSAIDPDGLGVVRALSRVGQPQEQRSVRALPLATEAAVNSEWMQHPGDDIALYRNGEGLGEHNVEITFRFDPSTRLRIYQFDPLHHGTAIMSIH